MIICLKLRAKHEMISIKIVQLEFELEQQKELANNRLHELEKMNNDYQAAIKQIEKLKADVSLIWIKFKKNFLSNFSIDLNLFFFMCQENWKC